jgi:hypothetical protein
MLTERFMDIATLIGVVASVVAAFASGWLLRLTYLRPRLNVSIWENFPTLNFEAATYHFERPDMPMTFTPELQINNTGSKAALSGCFVTLWLPKAYTFSDASLLANGWSQFTMKESFRTDPSRTVYWKIEQYISEPIFQGHSVRVPTFTISSPKGEADIELRWKIWYEAGHDPKGDPGVLKVGVRLPTGFVPTFD